jgi:hypothetical protein
MVKGSPEGVMTRSHHVDHDEVGAGNPGVWVVEDADPDERQEDDGQLEAESDGEHHFDDEIDVILGSPFVGAEAQPLGELHRGEEGDLHDEEVAEHHAERKRPTPTATAR